MQVYIASIYIALEEISDKIKTGIGVTSLEVLKRIDNKLIVRALSKMKSNKRDAIFDTVSDCYVNGPSELIWHITNLVRMYLVHGSVPYFILLCTLLPPWLRTNLMTLPAVVTTGL